MNGAHETRRIAAPTGGKRFRTVRNKERIARYWRRRVEFDESGGPARSVKKLRKLT
jgi:hypothetical protein